MQRFESLQQGPDMINDSHQSIVLGLEVGNLDVLRTGPSGSAASRSILPQKCGNMCDKLRSLNCQRSGKGSTHHVLVVWMSDQQSSEQFEDVVLTQLCLYKEREVLSFL